MRSGAARYFSGRWRIRGNPLRNAELVTVQNMEFCLGFVVHKDQKCLKHGKEKLAYHISAPSSSFYEEEFFISLSGFQRSGLCE